MSIFRLETFRLIGKTYKRFLSLTLIVFIGAGFMMGLMSTPQIMRESVDSYYDEYNLQDLVIYSPYGFCNEDYQALKNADGVETVYASKEIDVHGTDKNGVIKVIRVSELSKNINNFHLLSGRLPQSKNECLYFYNDFGAEYGLGDKFVLDYGNNDINDYLSENEFTVVGLVESPQYLGKMYGASNFNNEEIEGIIMVPNVNFISNYFTTMYVTLDGASRLLSDTEAYDRYIEENKVDLENVISAQQPYLRNKLIAEATEQLEDKENLFEQMKAEGQKQLDDAKKQLDEAGVQIASYEAQLNVLNGVIRSLESSLKDAYASIYGFTLDVEEDISDVLNFFGLNGFNAASAAMEYTYNEYVKAINQFNSLSGQLSYAKSQYTEGLLEYEKAKIEYESRIGEAEEELKSARHQLENLPKSEWIMLDRSLIYAQIMYRNNTQQMQSIGIYMPMMFFLVAALVCLTTMKRLVDEQRGQIGIYVALGYSNAQIIGKYVTYALLASLCGGIIGSIIGQMLFPSVIYNTWRMAYYLPKIKVAFPIKNLLLSVGSFAGLICGITAFVVNNIIKDTPASLMRPVAPKKGKELMIEKITFLWNAFSFTSKITARNIFRYKSRFLMTIAGIAGCTALLIMGFGIKDSVNDVLGIQYGKIYNYDFTISLSGSDHVEEYKTSLNSYPDVEDVTSYMDYTTRAYLSTGEKTAQMVVIDARDIDDTFSLRETDKKTPIRLNNDGVVVSELFAKNNHLKVGDIITIESKNRIKGEVKISNICEMYFQHFIFISDVLYENTFDETVKDTVLAISSDNQELVQAKAAGFEDFLSMTNMIAIMKEFNTMIQALNLIILVIILVAGSLAFVVLVNLTQVNISERVREIATLKVLGFNDHEVNMYIFKEIMMLSLIGCIVGIPIGIIEHRFIMNVLTMEMIMFGRTVNLSSFVFSILITIIFTIIVLSFMRKPLQKVDMVESLKSVE
jgi:putative ABC transport system permease protein